MTIRTRRLRRDHAKILAELAGSEFVSVRVIEGDPPNHYRVTYRVNGLKWEADLGRTAAISEHEVDVFLPIGYPKIAPRCTMRTPVWHPNIGDYVCIGDFWSAGVTLVDIIAHIGDMLQYKTYNLRSPVNKAAADWAARHERSFPVGTRDIIPPDGAAAPPQPTVIPPSKDDLDISLGPVRDRN